MIDKKVMGKLSENLFLSQAGFGATYCPTCQRLYCDPDEVIFIKRYKECASCESQHLTKEDRGIK